MDMKIGDLCWAKMKGFPPWPGKIIEAPHPEKYRYLHKKRLHHYIYFYGSGNYAWVQAVNIKPNSEEAMKLSAKKKSILFQKAIQQFKREMARNSDLQKMEEKYCRQGVIKKCTVVIKRVSLNTSNLKRSNSLLLNEVSSPELCHNERVEPLRKIMKTDDSTLNADNMVDNGSNNFPKCHETVLKKFGFIGRGKLGKEIVENLLKSKCDLTIWSQTVEEYGLSKENRTTDSFLALIVTCDIIVCCIHREDDAQSIFRGNKGILRCFTNYQNKGKGFVLLANIDLQVSAEIAVSIQSSGCRYLAAPFLGSEMHSNNEELLILCSGDESLFHDCGAVFTSIKKIQYLGPNIELAQKLHTVLGLFVNSIGKSYKEASNLIHQLKLSVQSFNDLLKIIFNENFQDTLCHHPLERIFSKNDKIRFFIENLNLKTLLAANFSPSSSNMQKKLY